MPERMFAEERTYTQADLDKAVQEGRTSQQVHDVRGAQQAHMSADVLGKTVAAAVSASLAPMLAPLMPPKPAEKDLPSWMKVLGATLALIFSGATVLGIVWSVAIGPVQNRLDALEKADVAALATLTGNLNRLGAAENKIAQIETTITTAGRIRDQQQQGLLDQVRGLSQADQQADGTAHRPIQQHRVHSAAPGGNPATAGTAGEPAGRSALAAEQRRYAGHVLVCAGPDHLATDAGADLPAS
jgi:hypothetical protein